MVTVGGECERVVGAGGMVGSDGSTATGGGEGGRRDGEVGAGG